MAISRIPALTQITKEFTSSGTWTCPSGVYSAEFLVVGAGGGGGGSACSVNTRSAAGGGGGGGAVKYITLPVVPGNSYTITIGAKGAGGNATAGGNGGFSEVLLSGTTLIRAFGGQGGFGIDAADAEIDPVYSQTIAAAGGKAKTNATGTNLLVASGGGGAFYWSSTQQQNLGAVEGSRSYDSSITTIQSTTGLLGINGFGSGGGAGVSLATTASGVSLGYSSAPYGAGVGGRTAVANTAVNGTSAVVSGSGGGGSVSRTTLTAGVGGNGADGIVRITYLG